MVQLFHTYQKPLWKGLPTPLNVKIKSQLKLGGNGPLLYRPTQIGTQTDPNQNGQDRKEIYAPQGTILNLCGQGSCIDVSTFNYWYQNKAYLIQEIFLMFYVFSRKLTYLKLNLSQHGFEPGPPVPKDNALSTRPPQPM